MISDTVTVDLAGTPVRVSALMHANEHAYAAVRAFGELLTAEGATFLGSEWGIGSTKRVRCASGHEIKVHVGSCLRYGRIVCRVCTPYISAMNWTTYYVVRNPASGNVKIGVTASPKLRLWHHRHDGFGEVLRLVDGLSPLAVPVMERAILAEVQSAGFAPVKGREYFPADALPVILAIVDQRPEIRAALAWTEQAA